MISNVSCTPDTLRPAIAIIENDAIEPIIQTAAASGRWVGDAASVWVTAVLSCIIGRQRRSLVGIT